MTDLNLQDKHVATGTASSAAAPCRKCHTRRVKCSGGKPCNNCRRANTAVDCIYPQKDRLVRVSQQYIDQLIAENQRLQRRISQPELYHGPQNSDGVEITKGPERHTTAPSTLAPELASTPWFIDMAVPNTPILLAEASDSAFATRFRQAISGSEHSHIPRVNYPTEDQLLGLSDAACAWPSPSQARLLVSTALKCLGRWHHIVRGTVILDELEEGLQYPKSMGALLQSKFWVLFAIGKMYSTRTSVAPTCFPGLEYFAKATKILRFISERPTVEMVETWLLLSFYSLCLNRRHSAYSLAGSAVRVAIIMGLHFNVPEPLLTDPAAREHRVRVWWTAYIFDRMWATKLGYPVAIQDSDIHLDLPSNKFADSDFADCAYSVAEIGLARISGQIIHSIYGKTSQQTPLSERVHDSLSALRRWLKELPMSLQMDPTRNNMAEQKPESLRLLFNQLVMLATRPVLLHVFRTRLRAINMQTSSDIPGSASALSDACVRCARHSYQILTESWIGGTFMMFDYFYTQYLFTAATILAISGLLDEKDSEADKEAFDTAAQFLSQLQDNGNFVAAEFKQHTDAIEGISASVISKMQSQSEQASLAPLVDTGGIQRDVAEPMAATRDITEDMMLSEPFFHDLLSQPIPDLAFIDASLSLDSTQGIYWLMMATGNDAEACFTG